MKSMDQTHVFINAMQAFCELVYIFSFSNKIIIFLYHAAVDPNFPPSYFSDCFTELVDQKKYLLVVLIEKRAHTLLTFFRNV